MEDGPGDDSVRCFGRVEGVPEHVLLSVRAEGGNARKAGEDSFEPTNATASGLGLGKT